MKTYTDVDNRDAEIMASYQEDRIECLKRKIQELEMQLAAIAIVSEAEVERLRQNLKERQ